MPLHGLAQPPELHLAHLLGPRLPVADAGDEPSAVASPLALRLARGLGAPLDDAQPVLRPAPAGMQELIVAVNVNGMARGDSNAYLTASKAFLLPLSVLEKVVRIPAGVPRTQVDGEMLVFVGEIPGAEVAFDERALELRLLFPPALFARQSFRYRNDVHAEVTPSREVSALLTYSVGAASIRGAGTQWNFTGEADVAYRGWLLRNQYMRFESDERSTSLRGLTQLVKDDPARLTRFIAGDFFTAPTELTGGAILGGLSYSRSFDLDPYFVRQPAAAFSGVAELPSDVSLFVGNNRIYQQHVAPGPFDIGNVSYITGQRDVRIVVRDATGRERTVLFPFYFSDQGLAAGLQDFSYQLGALRENAATRSADFHDAAFSASHRVGVADSVTAGFHAEGTRELANAGPSLVLRSDALGVASLAFLASRDRVRASAGHAFAAQYTYQSGRFAGVAGIRLASRDFAFLRTSTAPRLALRDDFVSVSYGEQRPGTVSLSHRRVRNADEPGSRDSSLSYSVSLDRQWSLHATYRRTSGLGAGSGVDIGVQYLPREDLVSSASYRSTDAGARTVAFDFGNVIPEGEGLGYHVAVERSTGAATLRTISPALDYRMRQGELQLYGTSVSTPTGESTVVNALWGGSIAYVAGHLGMSRPMDDAFAVVQIEPPLAGVRVRLNSQSFGRTDAAGRIFLPRLVSYVENHVSLEDKDIPIAYALAARTQVIVPQPHTGYLALFEVRKVSAVSGTLRYRRAGRSLALDSVVFTVRIGGKPVEVATGSGGEFYFENATPGDYPAEVDIDGHACRFTLSIPAGEDPVVNVPDVQTCDIP